MMDRLNYLWRLLHKIWPLWNFTQPFYGNSISTFRTTHRSHLQYPNNPRYPNITQSNRCI